jgi:hypothetical protein
MRQTNWDDDKRRLLDVARLFLRLGFTAFGGQAAHIAIMREEVVRRRGGPDGRRAALTSAPVFCARFI